MKRQTITLKLLTHFWHFLTMWAETASNNHWKASKADSLDLQHFHFYLFHVACRNSAEADIVWLPAILIPFCCLHGYYSVREKLGRMVDAQSVASAYGPNLKWPPTGNMPICHHLSSGVLTAFTNAWVYTVYLTMSCPPSHGHQEITMVSWGWRISKLPTYRRLFRWVSDVSVEDHISFLPGSISTLWWTNILLWKITIFNGKIHYFYGNFQLLC